MRSAFDIKLLVVPDRLSMRERRRFQAGLELINRSATAIYPDLSSVTLTVNGSRSTAWARAVKGVPCDAPWRKLPPGQRLSIWWSLGEGMFEGPGRYRLVLRLGDLESATDVEVIPDSCACDRIVPSFAFHPMALHRSAA